MVYFTMIINCYSLFMFTILYKSFNFIVIFSIRLIVLKIVISWFNVMITCKLSFTGSKELNIESINRVLTIESKLNLITS